MVALLLAFGAGLTFMYWDAAYELWDAWTLIDGYYSHGPLVPLISLFFVWRLRHRVLAAPAGSSRWGYPCILAACVFLLVGDFLGFRVFTEFSMLPMILGLALLFLGKARTWVLWFPLVFLIFMVPIPASITQSLALNLKLVAAEASVVLANMFTFPMVREGSFIYFKEDFLIIGEVCGGLRSLIALLAFGALMAYLSRARVGARWFLVLMAPLIAMIANILRIFLLCMIAYFYGSKTAAGTVHDVSGFGIFAVAFVLFFALDSLVRRLFPAREEPDVAVAPGPTATLVGRGVLVRGCVGLAVALVTAFLHMSVVRAQEAAVQASSDWVGLDIPDYIGNFKRYGMDEDVDDHVKAVLETSEILIRPYVASNGYPVSLTVVYAGNTRRSLHFPEVCLVGAGWEVREQTAAPVDLNLTAKRLVLVKGQTEQAVLYWFKTGDVITGSYFVNAYHWALNQLTFGAPTSALIKVSAPIQDGRDEIAFAALHEFATSFTPIVMDRIP
jgi:EpsI family protein